jgi:peptide/nickel transport system substrate-binding protein
MRLHRIRPIVTFLLCLVVLGGFLVWWEAVPSVSVSDDVSGKPINVAMASAPTTLHPYYATDATSRRVLDLITFPLVTRREDGTLQTQVGEFEQTSPLTYTLRLAPLTFHDGTPFTARWLVDFLTTLQQTPASPYSSALQRITKIAVQGETVQFTLDRPDPFFASVLGVPLAKMIDGKPVGLGPYQLEAINAQLTDITLQPTAAAQALGKLPLHLLVVPNQLVKILKLKKGEVDVIHNELSAELFHYGQQQGLVGLSTPSASYTYIGFNLQQGVTADVRVRQALDLALDKKALRQYVLGGLAEPAFSLLLPTHQAYWPAPEQEMDLTQAQTLLDEAGFVAKANGGRFTLPLLVTTNALSRRVGEAIQQQWARLGVKVELNSTEWGTFYQRIKQGNFAAYLLSWVGPFDVDVYPQLFHSSQMPPVGLNRGRYHNAALDELLDNLSHSTNKAEQMALAQKIQQVQHQQALYLPLWRAHHVLLYRPTLQGCTLPVNGGLTGLADCRWQP